MNFMGYRRKNGRAGTRNHVLVFPTVICAVSVAGMISRAVPGTVSVTHPHGCGHLGEEKAYIISTMAGFCGHPNMAGGAQVIVFTTGRGTPLGAPIAPVIKVASNSDIYRRMGDNIDINAGEILDGKDSIKGVGERIFSEIIEVASGKLTRAEVLGHHEFAIHSLGLSV